MTGELTCKYIKLICLESLREEQFDSEPFPIEASEEWSLVCAMIYFCYEILCFCC